MVVLSLVCALILSGLASSLKEPQEIAKEIYRSKQMLVAAQIYSLDGHYFQMKDADGKYIPAKMSTDGLLVPGSVTDIANQEDILTVYRRRIRSFLVNDSGKLQTFEEAGINQQTYLSENKKIGYYHGPLKLIYEVLPDESKEAKGQEKAEGWIIPVNGLGLWDAIYGYLAIKPDGITVIGISWYQQKETPGLGANIAESPWQSLFPGKAIFQVAAKEEETDVKTAPIGITVVRGKVSEVYGDSLKAKSAVDGMTGATLTGNGVTNAYKDVLSAYRPFLIVIHDQFLKEKQ
ncbi:MAG: NADH:ubiquinone reductase (Na(+)-transporting) subunit C [Nitrosomonas sp.]|nr:MAG: NADH:ubiquinone reductase (Na(+)-transporting) subunit C [Nitrosomonas sp.]